MEHAAYFIEDISPYVPHIDIEEHQVTGSRIGPAQDRGPSGEVRPGLLETSAAAVNVSYIRFVIDYQYGFPSPFFYLGPGK